MQAGSALQFYLLNYGVDKIKYTANTFNFLQFTVDVYNLPRSLHQYVCDMLETDLVEWLRERNFLDTMQICTIMDMPTYQMIIRVSLNMTLEERVEYRLRWDCDV